MERIVVGIDGSETSVRALRAAIDQAGMRDAVIEAISVVPLQAPVWSAVPEAVAYPVEDPRERFERARERLETIIERVRPRERDVPIETRVTEGSVARTLLRAAEGAALLVVGSRGLGGFRGLLLGSVSQQCVSHAPCPVLVIPAAEERTEEPTEEPGDQGP